MAAPSVPSSDDLDEFPYTLQDLLDKKMVGEKFLEETQEDFAEKFSETLARRIVRDRGKEISQTVIDAYNGEEYRHWNITTWVIADWVLNKIGGNPDENPVDLTKEYQTWKQWIVGVETPYYIVKENGVYTPSEALAKSTSGAFTVTWIDAGTDDQPKYESHMVTVIGDQYYDTAELPEKDTEEDKGFESMMTFKDNRGQETKISDYSRNQFISPYTNFCTIWSWLFILKVPSDNDDGWEQRYIAELFGKVPSAAEDEEEEEEDAAASSAAAPAPPPKKKKKSNPLHKPPDPMLNVIDRMIIKLRL